MGRGLLAGLGAGGVVSVLGLGALSVLAPLPPDRAGNHARGGAISHASTEMGVPRAAPGPLAVPEPAPATALTPDVPSKPASPQRIEAPKAPELAQPPLPQADPMAAEPATPRIAAPGPTPPGPGPAQDTDSTPMPPAAELVEPAPAAPARPMQVDTAIVAPASETDPAARPEAAPTPVIPAAPIVLGDDGNKQAPTAESSVPVPPPGAARTPDLVPAASAGQPARVPTHEIILTPGVTIGPVKAPGPIILLSPGGAAP
ncbi:MAG TPA: hypothetical protein VGC40_04965 [Paenirhodobacter sp.]